MPSSRRTPRRRKHPRADMESAPTDDGECRGQPGKRGPALQQTSVGDDARIVPGTLLHRKVPGRDKSLPYKSRKTTRQTGTAVTTRASVGRDALIPPDPTAAQIPTGGYGIHPYGRRRIPRPTGKPRSRRTANLCRGRCLHRPADPASPQGPGRDKSRPYKPSEMTRQTGTAVTTQASVGRDALIPPDPAAAQIPTGGYGIHPYGRRRMPRPTGKMRRPTRETAAPRYNKPL